MDQIIAEIVYEAGALIHKAYQAGRINAINEIKKQVKEITDNYKKNDDNTIVLSNGLIIPDFEKTQKNEQE